MVVQKVRALNIIDINCHYMALMEQIQEGRTRVYDP